jgi:hypothetical protein
MGLDITAYSNIKFVHQLPECKDETGYDDHFRLYYAGKNFISAGDGLKEGCYCCEGGSFGFRAGSYSNYNDWRGELSKCMLEVSPEVIWKKPEEWRGEPFVELVNFSDCDGFIGPKTSDKLFIDFNNNLEKFLNWTIGRTESDWFIQKYKDWMRAFKIASNGGAVKFH